jgi:hypothetical protein
LEKECQLTARLLDRRITGLTLAEFLVLLLFSAIATVAVCFHEPWADEAQAWLIARDLGIPGILHQMGYEGSPPLWHLLLWVLTRLQIPYAALGVVSLGLMAAAMYVWLRWSPLPTPVRLLIPFTFYYQYQYSVVTRSYALSTLLAFAAVALWRAKPTRILYFGLVLALLAQTNMHGFMIAGGIACAFGWEWLRNFRKQRPSQIQVIHTAVAGGVVLASAVVARSLATPLPDCSFKAAVQFEKGTAFGSIAKILGGVPAFGTSLGLNMTWGLGLLFLFSVWMLAAKRRAFVLPSIITVVAAAVGFQMRTGHDTALGIGGSVMLLVLVLWWFLAMRQLVCALPFVFTVLAMGLVWSRPWHYGMALTAFLVSVWAAWPAGQEAEFKSPMQILQASLAVLLILQLPMTAKTIGDEVQGAYSGARATAEYLRPYVGHRPIYCVNFYGTGVQAYFDRNIFVDWPAAFWTWSNQRASESNRILYETPPANAMIVVPTGGQTTLKRAKSETARVQLTKRRFIRRHEFCGAQFWLGRVSEYECYEIYEKQR